MDRRRFVAALGGSSLLAGCPLGVSTREPTDSATRTLPATPTEPGVTRHAGESFETEAGYSVTVSNPRVHRSFVAYERPHTDVLATEDHQFLVFDLLVEGRDSLPAGSRVGVLLAGRGYFEASRAPPSTSDSRHSTRGILVPVGRFESGSVLWDRADVSGPPVRWALPDGVLAAVATPPRFEVRAFDVPDAARDGSTVRVSVTVANTGARDGVFRAELGTAAVSDQPEVSVPVEAGETAEYTELQDVDFGGRDALGLVLRWGTGRLTRTVERESV